MQEDIQGILSKGNVESHYTQTFWTNVSFGVSARALVKKVKERVDWLVNREIAEGIVFGT
jgi:hypothetical protein